MKLIKSFGYALQGIKYCFKTQLNFRIHLLAIAVVVAAGFIFAISNTEWLFVVACFMAVLTAEMLNTAIEKLCDTVTKEQHPVMKIIKDTAAGAVLVGAAGSGVVAAIIFLPKIIAALKI